MRAAVLALAILVLVAVPVARAVETGHLEIKCEPGAKILLDDAPAGETTEDQEGLILKDVAVGKHRLTAEMPGRETQRAEPEIKAGDVTLVTIQFVPAETKPVEKAGPEFPSARQGKTGTLLVQSLPIECELAIPLLGTKATKGKDKWQLDGLPLGKYEVQATDKRGNLLAQEFVIDDQKNQRAHLFFNFLDGEVVDLGRLKQQQQWLQEAHGKLWKLPDLGMPFAWVVTLNGWMAQFEVGNAQFRVFDPTHDSGAFHGLDLNADALPVANVSYYEAVAFAEWLTKRERDAGWLPKGYVYRLPKAAEWLLCAQCGDAARAYPWGREWPPTAGNYADRSVAIGTGPALFAGDAGYNDGSPVACVGTKSGRNDWDLYGLGGNVAEWVQPDGARGAYVRARGGSWHDYQPEQLRAAAPGLQFRPTDRVAWVGFRLLLVNDEPPPPAK